MLVDGPMVGCELWLVRLPHRRRFVFCFTHNSASFSEPILLQVSYFKAKEHTRNTQKSTYAHQLVRSIYEIAYFSNALTRATAAQAHSPVSVSATFVKETTYLCNTHSSATFAGNLFS